MHGAGRLRASHCTKGRSRTRALGRDWRFLDRRRRALEGVARPPAGTSVQPARSCLGRGRHRSRHAARSERARMTYVLVGAIVLAAFAAVAWPFLRREDNDVAGFNDTAMEHRIEEYRTALKADTVCKRCLRANPTDARYCAECGNLLQEIENKLTPKAKANGVS